MTDTEAIKQKIDIADLIGEYVQLRPAGASLKGLCPFHNEKSPSFMVNRERQRWHCFGCSKGGDIFSFVEDIEGMDFVEVLKMLADRAGVVLTKKMGGEVSGNKKNRLKEINEKAAVFFHEFLVRMPTAEEARMYVRGRGLTDDNVATWQIGFAPDQWDLLTKYLLKKGYAIEELVASGLIIRRDTANVQTGQGFYDRFRDRVMFPIRDVHGAVVGFTGRVLNEHEKSGGKYINTPQTDVYDKSRIVFGLDMAKQSIRREDKIVLVEGQMDVVACHRSGMENVVASSGTALSESQITLLSRYSKNIAMAFDADEAGQSAAKRGIDLALIAGMNISVITIPPGKGKDPDECISNDPAVWSKCVDNARDIMEWYFEKAFVGVDITSPSSKQKIADMLLLEIHRIPFAVVKDHWLRELSTRLGVDTNILREDMGRLSSTIDRYNSTTNQPKSIEKSTTQTKESKHKQLAEHLLSLMLKYPTKAKNLAIELEAKYFPAGVDRGLYETVRLMYTDEATGIDMNRADILELKEILLMRAELEFLDINDVEGEMNRSSVALRREWKSTAMRTLEQSIAEAEKSNDSDRLSDLLNQLQQLIH
jgi:DNA primase